MQHLLQDSLDDLKKTNQLIVIPEEVDPHLVMSAIHLKVYARKGPAILFERVKGSRYKAVSNLFGTLERSKYIFRKEWNKVEKAIALRNSPVKALKKPVSSASVAWTAINALPKKNKWKKGRFEEIQVTDLPLIQHWPEDGGAFITLPQVYSEDPLHKGIMNANLGMYRVQLTGNDYELDKEVGVHYQIHRGIGVHQSRARQAGKPLKVSIFIGGHPAHTLSAVMPLPEGLSEMVFAGMLAGRRFRYAEDPFHNIVSLDADFIITGEIEEEAVKPEGPFGDHLGYYSLVHPFPVMKVNKVYARKNAIWPFTVVGRPPQEDTSFGALIHELTGSAIQQELPGVKEVHAVDAAGVHPLLLAVGSERYTPYTSTHRPAEILTQANRILGTGQLSLAKYLLITAPLPGEDPLSAYKEKEFIAYLLERVDWKRDVHFQTCTTIDTLDYSGGKLNEGSKVVLAAYGAPRRTLGTRLSEHWQELNASVVSEGILALGMQAFTNYEHADRELQDLICRLEGVPGPELESFPLIIVCDDPNFMAADYNNFLWAAFTRSNPSHDIYGIGAFSKFKHWGCKGPLIIDARMKPYIPPELIMDSDADARAEEILKKYWPDY